MLILEEVKPMYCNFNNTEKRNIYFYAELDQESLQINLISI